MLDENAFGILLSYHAIDDEEYRLTPEEFARSFGAFRDVTRVWLENTPLPTPARALFLGHALYVEWPDPADADSSSADALFNPIAALREVRRSLSERDLQSVAVLTHGSRWVREFDAAHAESTRLGDVPCLDFGYPSEPLRKALQAELAAHAIGAQSSWGPGLYLDTEAVEALGKRPQNQPTLLELADASFYRAGS